MEVRSNIMPVSTLTHFVNRYGMTETLFLFPLVVHLLSGVKVVFPKLTNIGY